MNPAASSLSPAERELFVSSARSALKGPWPSATTAGTADAGLLGRVWDLAAECGWFELGGVGDLTAAVALTAELGRVACPLPVLDGFVAVRLAGPLSWLADGIAAGEVRVLIAAPAEAEVRYVEAAPAATHLLLVPEHGGAASVRTIAEARPRVGLAAPAWYDVTPGEEVAQPRGSAGRAVLGRLAARLQATRVLVAAAITATTAGRGVALEAPMAGVLGGELAEEFGEAVLDLLGPQAALAEPHDGSPIPATLEYELRLSLMYVIGGGTNDIQRGLIARGLGLPR